MPRDLGEVVSPTFDMRPFYEQGQIQRFTATNAAVAIGGNVSITVPQGQAWIVKSFAGLGSTNGVLICKLNLEYSVQGGDVTIASASQIITTATPGTFHTVVQPYQLNTVHPPGTVFRCRVRDLDIATTSVTIELAAVVMSV